MKRLATCFLLVTAALLPLTACNNGNQAAKPLPKPNRIPDDDTKVFRPNPIAPPDQPKDEGGGAGSASNSGNPTDPAEPDTGGGDPNSPVPEPATLLLVGTGLAGVALLRRRRREDDAD